LVQDNQNISLNEQCRKRLFYKDGSERINHTIQFTYYTTSENILWKEDFFKKTYDEMAKMDVYDITNKQFSIDSLGTKLVINEENKANLIKIYPGTEEIAPYIQIDWSVLGNDSIEQVRIGNSVAFRKNGENIQKFFVSLNDTKTDYVMSEKEGILYRKYKVKKGINTREVENIYKEVE
jgi:hypothetical protein